MSSFSKKDQNKAIFTIKKDSQGNIVVSQAAGQNGGEIRGSILRTNQGKPYLVSGYGMLIQSGSNTGSPGPGQITVALDLDSVRDDIEDIVVASGISGMIGPTGPTGPSGAQGPAGASGADSNDGVSGDAGPGITLITDNGDGTLQIEYGDGGTVTTSDLSGVPGTSISTVAIDPPTGELTITLTDATSLNVGVVVGNDGTSVTGATINGSDELVFDLEDGSGGTSTINVGVVIGPTGLGWSNGSYDAGTGIVTFDSDDGLDFSTTDLRGADGTNGTGFGSGDKYTTTVPIFSNIIPHSFQNIAIGTVEPFGVTEFNIDNYVSSTATIEYSWTVSYEVQCDQDGGVGPNSEYNFALQWYNTASPGWEDVKRLYTTDQSPTVNFVKKHETVELTEAEFITALVDPSDWPILVRVCPWINLIDNSGNGDTEKLSITGFSSSIQVVYTAP